MTAKDEEVQKELAWFRYQCDKHDLEMEKMRQQLDEAESNMVGLLSEHNRLYDEYKNALVNRKAYDDLLVDLSLKEDATEVYEQEIRSQDEEIRKKDAELEKKSVEIAKLATELSCLRKENTDLRKVNDLVSSQVRILSKEQNKNGIVDIIVAQAQPAAVVIPQNSASIVQPGSSDIRRGTLTSTVNQEFFKNTFSHLAIAQGAIGQFCGSYGIRLGALNCDTVSLTSSDRIDRRDAEVQTEAKYTTSSTTKTFCADCADLIIERDDLKTERHELKMERDDLKKQRYNLKMERDELKEKVREKQRKFDERGAKIDRQKTELRRKNKAQIVYKQNLKKQNMNIADLLEKMRKMEKEKAELQTKIREFEKRGDSVGHASVDMNAVVTSSNMEQGEIITSSGDSGSSDSDSNCLSFKSTIKRKSMDSSSSGEDVKTKRGLFGIKIPFHINSNERVKLTKGIDLNDSDESD